MNVTETDFKLIEYTIKSLLDSKIFKSKREEFNTCIDIFLNKDENFLYDMGATKLVLINSQLKEWVIKTPFKDVDTNYCKIEYENYLSAKEKGLEKYFAETIFLGYYDDVDFYLQRKASIDEDCIDDAFYSYSANLLSKKYNSDDIYFEDKVVEFVENFTSRETVESLYGYNEELVSFLDTNFINDLHSRNFGRLDNGNLVMIDFSGI